MISRKNPRQEGYSPFRDLGVINCYDSMKLLKPAIPVEIEHPKTHILTVMSEEYRVYGKMTPYTDAHGVTFPLDSWMEIVPAY